jgi:arginase family enzyme
MPLAFVTGLAVEKPVNIFGWLQKDHLLKPQNLVYIGLRDLDDSEIQHLKEHKVKAFWMDDVRWVSYHLLLILLYYLVTHMNLTYRLMCIQVGY